MIARWGALGLAALAAVAAAQPPDAAASRGLTAVETLATLQHDILDADGAAVEARLPTACAAAPLGACRTISAAAVWWRVAIEPESRAHDAALAERIDAAITTTESWTRREPRRAEAWFYLGAAYALRVQARVLRGAHLSAARDGGRIEDALTRALTLDPDLHDANLGLGMYRYYADVAPRALRWLRRLLLLPGGDRRDGLARLTAARAHGRLLRGDADYQLQQIYLWYEQRTDDALVIVRDLQQRYPRNPHFHHLEAEIEDVYRHDARRSLAASERLLALAERGAVNAAALAAARAQFNIAVQQHRLGDRAAARARLRTLLTAPPAHPAGLAERARRLLDEWDRER